MAKHWDAIVLNDYEAVMPLPLNQKMGIAYLYQPAFTQQLGIFSNAPLEASLNDQFIRAIQQQFKFAELFINCKTESPQPNYLLPLHAPYASTKAAYKPSLLKSLQLTKGFALCYKTSTDINKAIDWYQSFYGKRMPHVSETDYKNFKAVCAVADLKNEAIVREVTDENGATVAISLLLKDRQRLYNMISAVTESGRKCAANHFLYDQLIREFAQQPLVLDFEGSAIKGVASFYQNFGAINKPYYFLRYNHLPWPLRYLK